MAQDVIGPDGQHYQFPDGTSKDDAVRYFSSMHAAPSKSLVPNAIPAPPTGIASEGGPNSVAGGMVRRGATAISGLYHTITDPPQGTAENIAEYVPGALPLFRMGKGVVGAEKEAGSQVASQVKAIQPGSPWEAYARPAVTAASMLDPFATPSVTNVNKLEDQNRHREAIGQGGFDVLTMALGRKLGKAPTEASQVNKLTFASGGDTYAPIKHVLPEIAETVEKNGMKPQTIGDWAKTVQDTDTRLNNQFNMHVQGMGNTPISTQPIADALYRKAQDLPRSAAAEAAELRQEAAHYDGQFTDARELNADRMYRNGLTKGFHNKTGSGQMAAMRSNGQTMADVIVADETKNALYDAMEKRFPNLGSDYFRHLKQAQSSLIDITDQLDNQVKHLESAQASKSGAPVMTKVEISANAHPGGSVVTPRAHGLARLIPGRGPLDAANTAVRTAFGPTASATIRNAAVLSLPLQALIHGGMSKIPPPPQGQ